ncbi:3'-5' exonuclease [Nodosilinea sp. AN01ver1]|uniref:3'-5' exonuclease n=1 Tax=Nodosilinea sp. AN01ver1 TaxID=3423362 RepID=UPI003D310D3C
MAPNLIIIDTETTGVDYQKDSVIEIGAILYSGELQTVITQTSFLLYASDNPAEAINHIPSKALVNLPELMEAGMLYLLKALAVQTSYAVAHNAEFDRQWFDGEKLPILIGKDAKPIRWLCSMNDMTWPKQTKPRESLVSLALHHGIGVSSAHRALTDCQLIAELFNRVTHDEFVNLVAQALRPKGLFKAEVCFEQKQLAKDAGFQWHPESKEWKRLMAIEDAARLPFKAILLSTSTI